MRGRVLCFAIACLAATALSDVHADDFRSDFAKVHDRIWLGPALWANPMEDWRIYNGRAECISSGPGRNIQALTCEVGKQAGTLTLSVRLGRLDQADAKGSAGFLLLVQNASNTYSNDSQHRKNRRCDGEFAREHGFQPSFG
jgi:alkaline phosphatase D